MSDVFEKAASWTPPPGVTWAVLPGWPAPREIPAILIAERKPPEEPPTLVTTVAGELPARFSLVVFVEQASLCVLRLEISGEPLGVTQREVISFTDHGVYSDLRRLLELHPSMDWWHEAAVRYLIAERSAQRLVSKMSPEDFDLLVRSDLERADELRFAPEELLTYATDVRRAPDLIPKRRRDRVTPEVLRAAADVYRQAWADGGNPTEAVARHFHKSHSTAARWVGQARKLGILGPADGSRGGEIEAPNE